MSKENIFIFFILFLFLSLAFFLYRFNINQNEIVYLKILNSEDYIYLQKEDDDPKDLIIQFEEEYNRNIKPGEKKIKVIYDTYDTPENAFNILNKGNVSYDLVCTSEYITQKMANLNLLDLIDKSKVPNYFDQNNKNHCSLFIRDQLKKISTKDKKTLFDYSLCYMWGTLGIIYNPKHSFFAKKNMSIDKIVHDMNDLDIIWEDKNYRNSIMVKDSIRDVYSLGVIKTFSEEIKNTNDMELKTKIFNRGGETDKDAKKHIQQVYENLLRFKDNIRGFEIDNGKEDIVNEKIAIDLAWSGDAIYAIQKAKKEKNKDLFYSIPRQGTNMWFDSWVIPKTSVNKDIAYNFLNFIFHHKHAIENMKYTGFTSSIIGKDIFNFFKEKYDRKNGDYSYDLTYFFKENELDNKKYIINIFKNDKYGLISAQFVENSSMKNLMTMHDFGKNNDLLNEMFNNFKNDSLPSYAFFILFIEFFIFLLLFINKRKNKIYL